MFIYVAPPRIIGLRTVERLNGILLITCVTTGTPEAVVDWLDCTPIPPGSFSVHDGSLQIAKRFINTMKFVCNASNVYGWVVKYVSGIGFMIFLIIRLIQFCQPRVFPQYLHAALKG